MAAASDSRPHVRSDDAEAIRVVWQVLGRLKKDDRFHEAIDCEEARRALRHWCGEARLKPEETEDWVENPRIMSILASLKQLQHACHAAGMKVPLQSVLARSDVVDFPDGSKVVDGRFMSKRAASAASEPRPASDGTARQVGEASNEQEVDGGELDEQEVDGERLARPSSYGTRQAVWQIAALLVALVVTRIVLWISPGDWDEVLGFNVTELATAAEAAAAAAAAAGEAPSHATEL